MKKLIAVLLLALFLSGCGAETKDAQESDYDRGYREGYAAAQNEADLDAADLREGYEERIQKLVNEHEEELLDGMREAYDYGYDDGINGREYGYSY